MKKTLLTAFFAASVAVAFPQAYVGMFDHNSFDRGERVMQYRPDSEGYIVSHNGKNLYTRALYGGNTAFRMETGDMPVFAAFHGKDNRNVHFIMETGGRRLRLDSVADCVSKYRGGERRYELSDPSWGSGRLTLTLLAPRASEGGIWKVEARDMPGDARLTAVSCATVPVKLNRNGDMGADPANALAPDPGMKDRRECAVKVGGRQATAYIGYAGHDIKAGPRKLLAAEYEAAKNALDSLTSGLRIETPDPYINVLGPVITHAADGNYDGRVWLHGAIGWRMPLSGWRGAYMADFLGWHDRGRSHFDAYALSQVTGVPALRPHPAQDPEKNMARAVKEWGTQMYSDGYICRNPARNDQMHHYDMNLCYIDELLWHLQWTGDIGYARRMWPVITSHLAWEKRNFDPDNDGLYDAYCCIWASDALYYNSGAVTHSSAYNCRANRIAAEIARKIGEDYRPYELEASRIRAAMDSVLWMADKGVWAEYQDFMGHRRLHDHPALWTVYHAIDSEVADPFMAYSATRYVDNNIPHIPVTGVGLEDEGYATVSTTDWLPYAWSINNVAFAEVYHTALAYWQAGRPEEAARLLKSAMLDGMFLGNSPGNIGQISHYDAARGECYRDFADPVAMMTRAVVQGLFGFSPALLDHRISVRPGFPSDWRHASIAHPDFSLDFRRDGMRDTYDFSTSLDSARVVDFTLSAPYDGVKRLTVNGSPVVWGVNENSVERPSVTVSVPVSGKMRLEVEWEGAPVGAGCGATPTGRTRRGFREVASGQMRWWEETESFRHAVPDEMALGLDLMMSEGNRYESLDLSAHYNACVTDIFRNSYLSPRSPYTTLQIPVQGIGEWCHPEDTAHIDDSGLRSAVGVDGLVRTSAGIPFASAREGKNVIYTSLFDNYPDSATVALGGKARGLELLMAGSTNHMQCHMENARLTVRYADGTLASMPLVAPYNWVPVEQDYFIDGKAFEVSTRRPWRMIFKDGRVTDDVAGALGITGVYGRRIDGGAGIMLCLPLDPSKELESLTLTAVSNDIVAGLLAVTYLR